MGDVSWNRLQAMIEGLRNDSDSLATSLEQERSRSQALESEVEDLKRQLEEARAELTVVRAMRGAER